MDLTRGEVVERFTLRMTVTTKGRQQVRGCSTYYSGNVPDLSDD